MIASEDLRRHFMGGVKECVEDGLQLDPPELHVTKCDVWPGCRETKDCPGEPAYVEYIDGWFNGYLALSDNEERLAGTRQEYEELLEKLRTTPAEDWGLTVRFKTGVSVWPYSDEFELMVEGDLVYAEVHNEEALLKFKISHHEPL